MIRQPLAQLKTGPAECRRFGLWVGGAFALAGAGLLAGDVAWHVWVWGPGLVLAFLGWVRPGWLKQVYVAWMTVGIVAGALVGTVLLTSFFYLMVTPLGWLARVSGKDFLDLKWDRSAPTYWLRKPSRSKKSPQDYERQY